VSVRSGGHGWCAPSLREGGLLLDLSRLDELAIDADATTATVGPAVTGGMLARALTLRGLAFPVGHCASVALGGFLLSGGLGWNPGAWGPACGSVAAVDVVLADGSTVRADGTRDADLLWAARGGGPAFPGIVTRFHLRLHPLPRAIRTSTRAYPLAAAREFATWATALAAGLPPHVEITIVLGLAPAPAAKRCAADRGRACVVSATAFADDEADVRAALAPLAHAPVAPVWTDADAATPLDALLDVVGTSYPERHRYRADTLFTDAPAGDVLAAAAAAVATAPSPRSLVLAAPPPRGVPPVDGAFPSWTRLYVAGYAVWDAARDDDANARWHADLVGRLALFARGHYVGESDLVTWPARARGSYTPTAWARLAAVRAARDPERRFFGWFDE